MENDNSTHNEPKIYVYYLSNPADEEIVKQTLSNFFGDGSVCIIIPTIGQSRLECINPKYITDEVLIQRHSLLLEELHEHIRFRLEQKNNG
jgi:hypothetical protein